MRIVVLGAGAMGSAAARLLVRHDDVKLVVADADAARARASVEAAGTGEARSIEAGLERVLQDADAVASCVPYRLNLDVMEAALASHTPYADLGGLFHVTRRQLELDTRFREAGLAAVAGVGCCPGLSNVMARLAADRLDEVRSIDIFDGARDESDSFGVPYSLDTILDEFTQPAMIFEDGELREVPAGSGAVRYRFPDPVGELEAVYTLHSEPATLPDTIPGVRDVRWRLALPAKLTDGFRLLADLGLASEEPVETPTGTAVPRDILRAVLGRRPPAPDEPATDMEVLVVRAAGTLDGRAATLVAEATFRPQPEGIGGGAFGTAIPIAVGARWLAEGRVPAGVHPPENAFAADAFLEDLRSEGVELEVREDPG